MEQLSLPPIISLSQDVGQTLLSSHPPNQKEAGGSSSSAPTTGRFIHDAAELTSGMLTCYPQNHQLGNNFLPIDAFRSLPTAAELSASVFSDEEKPPEGTGRTAHRDNDIDSSGSSGSSSRSSK